MGIIAESFIGWNCTGIDVSRSSSLHFVQDCFYPLFLIMTCFFPFYCTISSASYSFFYQYGSQHVVRRQIT